MPPQIVPLTPAGRGALASCLVAGSGAEELLEPLVALASGRRLSALPLGRIAVGHWRGAQPEEVVVVRRAVGEVLLHCHGGIAAIRLLMSDLAAASGEHVVWPEWFARPGEDPLKAEAAVALSAARTERTAAILLDQMQGALRRDLEAVLAELGRSDTASAVEQVARLVARADSGRHLVEPYQVVLYGEPNVGKSSLINALVGYRRAIVHSEPGTTRDVVTASTALDGWPVELSDTAGLRAASGTIESAGIAAARDRTAAADLRLLVFDRAAPFGPAQQQLAAQASDALVVHNKADLAAHPDARPEGLRVSALSGEGIAELLTGIVERLVPEAPPPGAGVPFCARHTAGLTTALHALRQGDTPAAAAAIESLLR